MTSSIYTLQELVDIALQTPEVGAVNFNVLRIILLKILSELHLENITVKWKPAETSTDIKKILEDKELPDHPIRMEVLKEKTSLEVEYTSKKVTESEDPESSMDKLMTAKSSKDEPEELSKAESETIESGSSDEEREVRVDKPKPKLSEMSPEDTVPSKSLKAGTQLWQMWQIKKAAKRTEAIEEIVHSLARSIDELQEFKSSRMKRTKFEEGEKLQSDYHGPTIFREEFEHTVDEIGEAMARVTYNQRQQKDECNTISQSILKEMSLKASLEDLSKHVGSINKKLRTLGTAVRNIQKLIKDIIYPEACGITKCMSCGRKSHLPLRYIAMDPRIKSLKSSKSCSERSEKLNKQELKDELKFTRTSLGKFRGQMQETPLEEDQGYIDNQQDNHPDRPIFPEYLIQLEPLCDIEDLSRGFAPLRRFPDLMRRNTIRIPAIRPKQSLVSISLPETNVSKNYFRL